MAFWSKKKQEEKPEDAAPPAAALPQSAEETPAAPSNVASAVPAPVQATSAAAQSTPEQAQAVAALREKAQQIIGLMKSQSQFQAAPEGQVETLVSMAVSRGQFLVVEAQSKETGEKQTVGAVLWAMVSPDIDKKLSDLSRPIELSAQDWKGGDIPWLIAMVGDNNVVKPMLKRLQTNELKGRDFKMRMKDKSGNARIGVVNAAETNE